jgi:hypothetical protein
VAGEGRETMTIIRTGPTPAEHFRDQGQHRADRQTPCGRLQAASHGAFATLRQRLTDHASDGTINDFGPVRSIFFGDPDGLEGAVLIGKG